MGKGEDINTDDLSIYNYLSKEDIQRGDWLNASFLVSTNCERCSIIKQIAPQLAKHNKTHVICWQSDVKNWEQKPFNYMDIAEKDAALWEYFVANTEGFLNSNIQKSLGLANGTAIKYHSIVPQDEKQSEMIQNHLNSEPYGTVLYLEDPPHAVNVEIMNVNKNKWKLFSICTDKTVIPILQNKSFSKWKQRQIMGGKHFQPSRVEVRPLFPLEPGIAITIHKV